DLLLGYDGLSRIFGFLSGRFGIDGGGGGVDGGGGAGFGGTPGLFRLFNSEFVGQISWLIPFAVVALLAGLLIHARASRTDRARAGYLLWGGWSLVTAGVFSYMSGIIHPYYPVALAPAILAGPVAYSLDTVASVNNGAIPSAGPTAAGTFGGGDGFGRGGDVAIVRGGGPGQASVTSTSLVDYLVANKGNATWIVAVNGS